MSKCRLLAVPLAHQLVSREGVTSQALGGCVRDLMAEDLRALGFWLAAGASQSLLTHFVFLTGSWFLELKFGPFSCFYFFGFG